VVKGLGRGGERCDDDDVCVCMIVGKLDIICGVFGVWEGNICDRGRRRIAEFGALRCWELNMGKVEIRGSGSRGLG